ncbi:hypothetical protein KGA66_04220 [Actinocrinis puniceicyclus]|uniref:Uncharacterized protein n=1 Tax=Actinocrinis puniceicyclus TaxID=977794 RepID=A0A8J7WJ36_9ACTN|nr:hypothetical protein [Actinocrinis puniceicyclus]
MEHERTNTPQADEAGEAGGSAEDVDPQELLNDSRRAIASVRRQAVRLLENERGFTGQGHGADGEPSTDQEPGE